MTMIREIDQKCSVCGKSSPQPVLMSTNSMGYADLDFRPPEMQRSTMNTWIRECPHCGYVASDLGDELKISKDFLKSSEYLTCDGYDFKAKLSELFYRSYLIAKQSNDVLGCFLALRNCAWKCDDLSDENAIAIRKLALTYLEELIENEDEDKETLLLIRSDFLRRSGEFEQLIREYENLTIGDELLDNIVKFQIQKAHEKDTGCYTVKDVVEQ